MDKHCGIILKSFKGKNKLSLLDEHQGKMNVFVTSGWKNIKNLQPGMIIVYTVRTLSHSFVLEAVDIQAMPFFFARNDIFFLHHLLELCYYFLPIGSSAERIFYLLYECIEVQHNFWQPLHKKVFLWKFFALLGMYPEDMDIERNFFYCLIQKSVIEIVEMKIDDKMIKIFDTWLWQCITSHPQQARFKTIDLLRNNGVL